MTLTSTKLIENIEFSVRPPNEQLRRFKYDAGKVVEFHPLIAAKLIALGYGSSDPSAASNPKATPASDYLPVWLTDTDGKQLELRNIEGTDHKLVYAIAKLIGDVELEAGSSAWMPTPEAEAAIATGAAVALRWPEPSPYLTVSSFHGSTPVTVTV